MDTPTRTTNKLHFEDIEPHRFEDLAYDLLYRKQEWKRIDNWGRCGSDDGIDVYCEELTGQKWFCQCKRYKSLQPAQVKDVVDKIISNNRNTSNGIILLVVACSVSKRTIEVFKEYSLEKGFKEAIIWQSSTLEAELYDKHKDLLEKYFGYPYNKEQDIKEKRIVDGHRIRKEVEEKLLSYKITSDIQYAKRIQEDPTLKFIYDAAIIHSTDEEAYPEEEKNEYGFSRWFKCWFYDITHEGVEFLPKPYLGTKVAVNTDNRMWRELEDSESPLDNEIALDVDYIGLIPYYNIVHINNDGDDYFPIPHMYCRFEFQGLPYSKCYLKNRKLKIDFFEGKPIGTMQFRRIIDSLDSY